MADDASDPRRSMGGTQTPPYRLTLGKTVVRPL
jgi:hypothetical protein